MVIHVSLNTILQNLRDMVRKERIFIRGGPKP
jgi:hypothetical protein